MTYSEKLKDPRWQRMRLEVMERDEFKCCSCFVEDKTLHVHHSYYTKGADPWDYPLEALSTQCADCHKEIEEGLLRIRKAIGNRVDLIHWFLRDLDDYGIETDPDPGKPAELEAHVESLFRETDKPYSPMSGSLRESHKRTLMAGRFRRNRESPPTK